MRPLPYPRSSILVFMGRERLQEQLKQLQCFLLQFPDPSSWSISSLIQFLFNNLGLPPVVHLSLHLSACPIEHLFQPLMCIGEANIALFRDPLYINVARKLAAEPLMRWQQLSPQIFQDSPLYFVFAMLIYDYRISRNVLPDGRPLVRTSAWFIRGGIRPWHAFLCHYVPK